MSEKLEKELIKKITPICMTDDEVRGITRYVRSEKYRQKLIDYIDISEQKEELVTPDDLMLLAIRLSNEEKKEGLR